MRKSFFLLLLLIAIAICVIWIAVSRKPEMSAILAKNKGNALPPVQVDPYPITAGSWVSVMSNDDSLGMCIKDLDKQSLGRFHESTTNADAVQFIKQCPNDKEAWLVGHGSPGKIFTAAGESIADENVGDFNGLAASELRLFGCWTGASDLGAKFVHDIYAHTQHNVWAQNSEVFCVPGDNNSSPSKLYVYHNFKPVEASSEQPYPIIAQRDLFDPTPNQILLSDNGSVRQVFPDFVMIKVARVAHGPIEKKDFPILEEDRASTTNQFVKTVDFGHPFGADPAGKVAIPLARPTIQVTFLVEGKLRSFTVYGGGLLGDDEHRDTFYQMDLPSFDVLTQILESKYTGLFE